MVDKQRFFLPCFVVCAIFSAIVTAQTIRVDTDPHEIIVTENQRNVSLTCRVGRPIQFCTFTLPNRDQQVALDPNQPPRDGLQYFGQGLQAGACGVTIDRITTAHNGQMKCSLFVDGRSAEGIINVIVAVAPSAPEIQTETDTQSFEVDSKLVAHCFTKGGNPGATLAWFLEDEPIYQGVSQQQEFEEEGQNGVTNELALHRFIQASDSGKRLICEAKHIAYPEGISRTFLQITVNFAPQALPETTVHGLTLGRTVDVTLTIRSNPSPRTFWTVDGVEIEQGLESGRFSARVPEPLGNDAYNVTLTIAGLTLEDLTKTFHMRASNRMGAQDYVVMLSSSEAEVDESGGVGIGGIIGIVLAALIVLTAIALIIVARATGRWCFRGKATSASASNARIGETDTESADLKQPITKTQRLKVLFGRKRAESLARGEEIVDNELPTSAAGGGDDDGANPEDHGTKDPGSEPKLRQSTASKTEEPSLVYAELELKPAEHNYLTKPESTEYAEILYVQKTDGGAGGGDNGPVVVNEASAAPKQTSE
ncbi:fasciclin-3-like isoform X2 [Topomyia yanbarensis]|uniref:fasciclin-3-like isoform X2 n=1 Tax=Topomyia yanbarensis TaxID=2498891 RepID=UPI00273C0ACB|nr:fasciclin-3-like isoform X2 [Topomyia yanbarensis]